MADPRPVEELLLDLHLDRLEDEPRRWLLAELERDAALRAKSERLGQVLRPLDQIAPVIAPTNLADRVLAFIGSSTASTPRTIPFPAQRGGNLLSALWGMRDLIAVAACIVLLFGVLGPGMSAVRGRAQRTMCASNLGSIFRGVSAYQETFAGALPYAGGMLNASWLPGADGATPFSSNSRHPYLLMKLKFVSKSSDFQCPSQGSDESVASGEIGSGDDFGAHQDISYDSLNLAGANPNVRPPVALAYMSDANPLFVGARFNAGLDASRANSPAHRGKGQTVLRLDGSAAFIATPVYATNGDNLWTITNVQEYRGTETPTRNDDAFLVPGFPTSQRR